MNTIDLLKALSQKVESSSSLPCGIITYFPFNTAPNGFLVCNGASVGRETYPDLFSAIGTTFGSGDGSTTFNLPNLLNKFIEGNITVGTEKSAGLPNIIADNMYIAHGQGSQGTGAWRVTNTIYSNVTQSSTNAGWYEGDLTFNASKSNAIYGASHTVQPPSVTMLPCIKAFSAVVNESNIDISNLTNDLNTLSSQAVKSVNGVYADTNGNTNVIESGSDYIRFASGVQICFGNVLNSTRNWESAVFTKPFANAYYTITATSIGVHQTNMFPIHVDGSRTSTYCSLQNGNPNSTNISAFYIAIGSWI